MPQREQYRSAGALDKSLPRGRTLDELLGADLERVAVISRPLLAIEGDVADIEDGPRSLRDANGCITARQLNKDPRHTEGFCRLVAIP